MARILLRLIPAACLLLGMVLVMAACVPQFSTDPEIAAKQKWIAGCKTASANIQTVTKLYAVGQLSEASAAKIDKVVDLHEVVCTGEPPAAGATIASGVVKALAAEVCPNLVPSNLDDWALTAVEAASCAAEGALLAEAAQ